MVADLTVKIKKAENEKNTLFREIEQKDKQSEQKKITNIDKTKKFKNQVYSTKVL
mgnify:CR=1 FL=1